VIVLVLGGARSGKSEVAERLAAKLAEHRPDTYVATGTTDAAGRDPDFADRIALHQKRRPAAWRTVEAGADLVGSLHHAEPTATVLVDSLGTWVAAQPDLIVDPGALLAVLTARQGPTVIVSDEVGLGVHPSTELGNRFRDVLGEVNREVADVADEVLLVIAGRVLPLDPIALLFDPTTGDR
jgi:adenosyl cobinamide kinase/adenosyl cobinamide phosphate guanylyltransferase